MKQCAHHMTRVAIPEVRIPEPWALGGSLGSRDSPSEGDLRVTRCTLQPVLPLCSPLRSSGPTLMLPVMRSFLARGSPWYPGQWDLQFLLCRLAGPKPIPGETTGPVQGAVPGVAEAWAGEAGGARLGKAGCWLGVWTLHAPFPSSPSRPAPQDPRRGGTQLHGPTCAGRGGGCSIGLFILHLVFLVWSLGAQAGLGAWEPVGRWGVGRRRRGP